MVCSCFVIFTSFFCISILPDALLATEPTRALHFSHETSGIKLNPGAQLTIGKPIANWEGTLSQDSGAKIEGHTIIFEGGILKKDGKEIFLSALFNPSGTIELKGDDSFHAEPGSMLLGIKISGENNLVSGQGILSGPIEFYNGKARATFALLSFLNADITLNNGTIFLDDNLGFAEGKQIKGPGKVVCNNRRVDLGGKNLSWTGSIQWDHVSDLALHSNVDLSSMWKFEGEGHLNGHGNLLDLSMGGTIWVRPNTKLYLSDIKIGGLGAHHIGRAGGWLFFENRETSSIVLQNVELELDGDYTVTSGHVLVTGRSTIGTKEFTLGFMPPQGAQTEKRLTIDGTTLFKTTLCSLSQGTIDVGLNDRFLDVVNCGTIKSVPKETDGGLGGSSEVNVLPGQFISTANVAESWSGATSSEISNMVQVGPNKFVWDGKGRQIALAINSGPQIILGSGHELTLSNIDLTRISKETFQFSSHSCLIIGPRVKFELLEDLTLKGDVLKMAGTGDTFIIDGGGGDRSVVFDRECANCVLNLGANILELRRLTFDGLENILVNAGSAFGTVRFLPFTKAKANGLTDSHLHFEVLGPQTTLSLTSGMGNIFLREAILKDFDIRDSDPLTLTLSEGSHVVLRDAPTTLKAGDILIVEGLGNVIEVTNDFTIEGDLSFGDEAELIIQFSERCAANPVVFLASDINLGPKQRLEFRGSGIVVVKDGVSITLGGTSEDNQPEIAIKNGTFFNVEQSHLSRVANVTIHGFGRICVDNGGEIEVFAGCNLILGTQETDNIGICVDREGVIRVDGAGAFLSLQKAAFLLNFEHGGQLTIGDGAVVEINALQGKAAPGVLSSWIFDSSSLLHVDAGGTLVIGPNKNDKPIFWNNQGGRVTGEGFVAYLPEKEFVGRLQYWMFMQKEDTALKLVSSLVQLVPSLSVSVVFATSNGKRMLRTVQGKFMVLDMHDEILRDVPVNGIVVGKNKNRPITIDPDGRRRF